MKTSGNIALLSNPYYLRRQAARRQQHLGDVTPGGLFSLVGTTAKLTPSGSQAQKTLSLTSEGAAIGTAIFPGIGTLIGGAIGAIGSLFGPSKLGQAALTWNDMTSHGYLFSQPGHAFDERYWAEAFKGMMDENVGTFNNCGSADHTNPDCFAGPLAKTVVNGYLQGKVPLNASVDQVYQTVVRPWLQSGANGFVNWQRLVNLANAQHQPMSQQELMIKSAVDRYIYGLPITRANMPEYASITSYAPWSQPNILTALASIIPQPTSTPAPAPSAVPVPVPVPTPVASSPAASVVSNAVIPVAAATVTSIQPVNVTVPSAIPFSAYPASQWLSWAQAADPTGVRSQSLPSGYLWGPQGQSVQVSNIPSTFWSQFQALVQTYATVQPTPTVTQSAAPLPQSPPPSQAPLPTPVSAVLYGSSGGGSYVPDTAAVTVTTPTPQPGDIVPGVPNTLLFVGGGLLILLLTKKRRAS